MGNYVSTQLLGHGVFSSIYLGLDDQGNKVVLKYYANKDSNEIKQKFMLEATSLTQIDHENILRVYDFGEDEKGFYLAMEFCEYGSLKGRLDSKGVLDLERTLYVALSVIQALNVFHQSGKLHLDVRPENLLFSNDGFLKLADLGTLYDKVQFTDLPADTLNYASPEFLDKRPVDVRSDIYSLGATVFHLLTARAPYESKSTLQVINGHLLGDIPSVLDYLSDCPVSVDLVVKKMLNKLPEERYQDMAELEGDIQAILEGAVDHDALPSFSVQEEVVFPPIIEPTSSAIKETSLPEIQTVLEKEVITTSPTQQVDITLLSEGEKGDSEDNQENTISKESQIDFKNISLTWKMRVLVACAWLVGPVILGIFVYKSYFSEGTSEEIKSKPVVQEKLVISADDFAVNEKLKVVAEEKSAGQPATVEVYEPVFESFKEKPLPVILESIDRQNYFCSFKLRKGSAWNQEILTLGQESSGVKLLHIDDSFAVIEVDGVAYKIEPNKEYNGGFELLINRGENSLRFEKVSAISHEFTLSELKADMALLKDSAENEYKVSVQTSQTNQAEAVSKSEHQDYIKKSNGVVVSLVDFKHDYFPILINKLSPSRAINYSAFINGTPVNFGNAAKSSILLKKYRVIFIGPDYAVIKDLSNDKNVKLKVKQKIILEKAAIVNYLGVDYKLKDGLNFFGYSVRLDEKEIRFDDGDYTELMNEKKVLSFLPTKESGMDSHNVKKYKDEKDLAEVKERLRSLSTKVAVKEETSKNKITDLKKKEKSVVQPEEGIAADYVIDKEYAARKSINLEHFLRCSTIKISHRKYSGTSSYSSYPVGYYLYKDGQMYHHPKYKSTNKLKLEDFEVTTRSIKIMGERAKYDNIGYGDFFFVKTDAGQVYEIEFVPNNYYTVKKLIKYVSSVSMGSGVSYDLRDKYARRAGQKDDKIVIRYDDENETIIIDKVPFTITADARYVYLVREGDKGYFYFDDYMYKYAR